MMCENGFGMTDNNNNSGEKKMSFADKILAANGVDKKQAEAEVKELKAKKKKDDRWNTKRLLHWLREEKGIEIWWNRITNKPFLTDAFGREQELDGALVSTMAIELAEEIGITDNQAEEYLYRLGSSSQNNNVKNPVKDAILGDYKTVAELANNETGTDKIDVLLDEIVRVKDEFDRRQWTAWLTNWLLVACDNEDMRRGMNGVLVLLGPQGLGKTAFAEWLCGPFYRYFQHTSNVNKDNKDDRNKIHHCLLCELAEPRDMFSKGSVDWWKDDITSKFDEERPFYGRMTVKTPRHCAYIATTNDEDILFDKTGTRRFYMSGLWEGFERKNLKAYDEGWVLGLLRQILALAYREQDNGITWLNAEEMKEQAKRNRLNTYIDKNESALYSLFEWGDEDVETEWQSRVYRASDVVEAVTELAVRSKVAAQRIKTWDQNITKTGNILKQWLRDGIIKEGTTKGKGRKGYILPEWSRDITLELKGLTNYTDSYNYEEEDIRTWR